jgi:hypothetical protein
VLREENLALLPKDFVRVQHDEREAHGRRRKTKYSIVHGRTATQGKKLVEVFVLLRTRSICFLRNFSCEDKSKK